LVGVKQQGIGIELALELPSESIVGKDGSPSLLGQDIGLSLYLEQKSGLLILRLFWRRFFISDIRDYYTVIKSCIPFGMKKSGTAEAPFRLLQIKR